MITLEDIKKEVEHLASKINAPVNYLPTYGYSRDSAYPHIEVHDAGFMHFVIVERGNDLYRKITDKLDELLYWIFDVVTSCMASDFEEENRTENKDGRRIRFKRQLDLFGILNESWKQKKSEEFQNILRDHPYSDMPESSVSLLTVLMRYLFG